MRKTEVTERITCDLCGRKLAEGDSLFQFYFVPRPPSYAVSADVCEHCTGTKKLSVLVEFCETAQPAEENP